MVCTDAEPRPETDRSVYPGAVHLPARPAHNRAGALSVVAIDYADRGFKVFPLHHVIDGGRCSCGHDDCTSQGKHPRTRHGFKDASDNPDTVARWWRRWPQANVGMPTGGWCFVLDVDPRHGGDATLCELEERYGALPLTAESKTGGGGRHLFFRHPDGRVRSRGIAEGLDAKGDGGSVVIPPSHHVAGVYRWVRHPEVYDVAEAPEWLLAMIADRRAAA